MSRYDLAGRTVVLTGSTGGLGAALATELRSRGANLALIDLHADAVATQAASFGSPAVARGWTADVRDLDSAFGSRSMTPQHISGASTW